VRKVPRRRTLPGLALCLLALAPGCGEATRPPERPRAVASIPPLAWFVDRLAGDAVSVTVLIPPGASPHSHEPSLLQVRAASRAILWVEVGHPSFAFERVVGEALLADRYDVPRVRAAEGDEDEPHVWLSPRRARGLAERIAQALAAQLPGAASAVAERRAALDAEIVALDREIAARLAPFRGRTFFVYHPDWSAFAADYGLRLVALERGHREPDARALQELIEAARREGARAVFVQPQFSRESAELVAREVGAQVVVIDSLAYDWPHTLRSMSEALARSFAP
jgi:zinc transport system substrate-binding protein